MSESKPDLEKLRIERQTVETELKARRRALKKLERETHEQLLALNYATQNYTNLMSCQAEHYTKFTGLIKETVGDLNDILKHLIAVSKGETPDRTADLFEALELKLLDKAKSENTAILKIQEEHIKQSDQVPAQAQQLLDNYKAEQEKAKAFFETAQARLKELEVGINRHQQASGHE